MTAIFVSHRSSDNAEAQALKDWLGAQGHEQLFLDFDPADGIPAGVDWEQRLYQELRRCQALLIVLTPAWLESMWCRNELAIAREKGKAVFIVRVKPCDTGPLIPAIQEVDLTADRDGGLAKLARGLKEHGLDPASAFDWRPGRPIYPGLAAFDVEDAAIFFGRSEESWQVVETLRRMRLQAVGSPKLLLITGASGSGKSSLMRAGVLARLRKEQASWIVARPFRRGGNALGALADAIAWAYPPGQRPASLDAITTRLAGEDGPRQLIAMVRDLRLALDRPDATLVLALDQAEEVLAARQAADAAHLLDLLRTTLAEAGNEILVLATIRSDRLGDWQQHGSIKAAAEHGEFPFEISPLGPMPMARIGEIVRGPAGYEGLGVEDELVEAIRADTNTPDALPLLAYTLRYLHDHFADDGRLALAEYRSFGGLEGSIRSQADAAIQIARMSEEDLRALKEAFIPGLVRATGDGGFSRSRARLATLPARAEPHLRRLIDDARVLLTDRDEQGNVTVEVAHEALLRVWPLLEKWIREDADDLRRFEAIQRAAKDSAQNPGDPSFLVHLGPRLSAAEGLARQKRFADRLVQSEVDYLAACRSLQDRQDWQRKRRIGFGLTGAALVLAALAVGVFFAVGRQQETITRLLAEASAAFRSGDGAGALVPLEKIRRFLSVLQPDDIPMLRAFWAAQMTPLPQFIRDAGPLSVVEINDRVAVTLRDGSVHLPSAEGRPLISFDPHLDAFIFADARTISLRDPKDFSPLIETRIGKGTEREGMRTSPIELLPSGLSGFALGFAVVKTRTLEITNDEDDPEEWHTNLVFLLRADRATSDVVRVPPKAVCARSTVGGPVEEGCPQDSISLASGFAAITHSIPDKANLAIVDTEWGQDLAILSARRIECDDDDGDNCHGRTVKDIELAWFADGQVVLSSGLEVSRIRRLSKVAISIDQTTGPAFPRSQLEEVHWRLATEIAGRTPASEEPEKPKLDFGKIEDSARYEEIYDSYANAVIAEGSGGAFWAAVPGGNSWLMYVGCRFEKSGVVVECKDFSMTALNADTTISSDKRFIAQRNCNGFEAAMQIIDMRQLKLVKVDSPVDYITGFAINPNSSKIIVTTDQNEVLTYTLESEGEAKLIRQTSLPRETGLVGEGACSAGRPVRWVDDRSVVGVSAGGSLFGIDTASGSIRWFTPHSTADGRWEDARGIEASPDGRTFAVFDHNTIQLVASQTGLPLTGQFHPKSLVSNAVEPEAVIFESAQVQNDGSIHVPCSRSDVCGDGEFLRNAPDLKSLDSCHGFELLTGRDDDGGRLQPEFLIPLIGRDCSE